MTTSTGQLHYARAGDGVPAVLIHQSPSSHAMWDPILPMLAARGYSAIAVDLPGHGMSDPLPEKPSVEDYADSLEDLLTGLGIARCHLVGHHTGVAVALSFAARHPRRVGRIAGWGIPLLDEETARAMATEPGPRYDRDGGEVIARWKTYWKYAREGSPPGPIVRSLTEVLLTGDRRADAHNALGEADVETLLREVAVPMLSIAGTREMLHAASVRAAELSPLIEYRELGDSGFFVVDEEPEAFADAVAEHLGTEPLVP
ncbi:MAG: alpha/beta fold hydrolase [Solirubrobacteraceae bacterium]